MTFLTVRDLRARYGIVPALHGIDLDVNEGEVAVVLGTNGAGKTTMLRALTGMVTCSGSVEFDDQQLVGRSTEAVVRTGIAHVPQGRGTISQFSVEENLEIGAYTRRDRDGIRADMGRMFELFPQLVDRRGQSAGTLSGGEQQMLAIARALMLSPRLLLLDEPSLGLAPIVVRDVFEKLAEINAELRTTILLVEQNAQLALGLADRAFILESGRIAMQGHPETIGADDSVRHAYLGY